MLFSKSSINGSYFGTCTCGLDKTDAVPCDHMATIAQSSRIPTVTAISIMPIWWKREQWRLQFPFDVDADARKGNSSYRDLKNLVHCM